MANRDLNLQPHPSLPVRPPISTRFAPPSNPTNTCGRNQAASPAFAGFMPRSVAVQPSPQMSMTTNNYPQATVSTPYQTTVYPTSNSYNNYSLPAYPVGASTPSFPAVPPPNRGLAGTFDPEEEARIAEWNSAYNREDASAKKGSAANTGTRHEPTSALESESRLLADGKRKTVVREGGGRQWEDDTLLEWNPLHPRLFIGNLAGEVTDESLLKAFAKYPSLSKARVVRDKKSTKSRSYGFVSFADTDDYFRAAKEMHGKYIGSHPVLVKRATSEVKAVTKRDDKQGKNSNHGKNGKIRNNSSGKASFAGAAPVTSNPVAFIPRGVQKKGKSNGPRVLG